MDTISEVQTAVCKSLQSIGLSPRKEHQIENALAIQIRSSGPEYVLKRLSDLTDWRKMHMNGETLFHPEWHAYKTHKGKNVPADPIGSQLWGLKDKAFFAATGALKKSVEMAVPSEKQLSKWLEGVRCENEYEGKVRGLNLKAGLHVCDKLEEMLEQEWTGRSWFNVSDISGTNIPGSGQFTTVKVDKRTCKKEPLSLLSAYGFSVRTAPKFIWQFLKDIDAPTRMSEGVEDPEGLIGSLNELIEAKLSDPRLDDEADWGSSFLDETLEVEAKKYRNSNLGMMHSVGNIGFLEQPGGKLRTVANPNRLVQYVNRPLGEVLSRYFYNSESCFVMDQEGGMKWAQSKLRQGISLSSFDMSSATDRLDYKCFLHSYFQLAYALPDRFPLLSRSLELFEDTSSCNWTIPGHIADLCNMPVNEIGWTVGQPLGLRPSFPLLTLMNMSFARQAIITTDYMDGLHADKHFACVGDDLIIESKFAERYMAMVSSFNGKINNDKSMKSDRFAEFCSQMITRSSHYPMKPRYLLDIDGSLQNVEKFTTSGLNPKVPTWVKRLHDVHAKYYLESFNTIKYSNSTTPATLMERIGVNTLIEVIKPASRDPERVSLNTLYFRAEQEREKLGTMPKAKYLSSSYADDAYPKFGGTKPKPNVEMKYQDSDKDLDYGSLGEISTDRSTSVDLPIKDQYDFRKASRVKPVSEINQAKSLARDISKIDTYVTGPLVESKTEVKGIETTILVDMSVDTPEISVSHRPHKANGTVEEKSDTRHQSVSPQTIVWGIANKRLAELKAKLKTQWSDDDCSDDDEYDR